MECLFFINPKSGAGAGEKLAQEIERFQLPGAVSRQVIFTDPARLETQVFSCATGKDLVVICGGDGTINRVISCLSQMDPAPAIALIPLGTGNDLARATGWYFSWEKMGLHGLYHAIKMAKASFLDVWELSVTSGTGSKSWTFCAYAGIGCDGGVCRDFARMEKRLKNLPVPARARRFFYIIPGLRMLFTGIAGRNRFCFQPESSGSKPPYRREKAVQLLFLNISSYAGGAMQARDVDCSDGVLDAFLFRSCLSYLAGILFSRLSWPKGPGAVDSNNSFRFQIFQDAYLQVDGEPCGKLSGGTRCTICQKRALPLLRPLEDDLSRNSSPAAWHAEKYGHGPAGAIKPIVT